MCYIRGNAMDYDNWASMPGLDDWTYLDCLPYFRKAETRDIGPNDYHGGEGPLRVLQRDNVANQGICRYRAAGQKISGSDKVLALGHARYVGRGAGDDIRDQEGPGQPHRPRTGQGLIRTCRNAFIAGFLAAEPVCATESHRPPIDLLQA